MYTFFGKGKVKIMKKWITLLVVAAALVALLCGCKDKPEEKPTESITENWYIVAAPEAQDSAEKLKTALESKGIAVKVAEQPADDNTGRVIYIGQTDEQTNAAADRLRSGDYTVSYERDRIVIAAGSQEKLQEAVDAVIEGDMEYLETYGDLPYGKAANRKSYSSRNGAGTKSLVINGLAIDRYSIVAENGENNEAAKLLREVIANVCGDELAIVKDQTSCQTDGMLVIASGKAEAAKGLTENCYHIYQDGRMTVLAASSAEQERIAVKMFCMKYLNYDYTDKASHQEEIEVQNVQFRFTCDWERMSAPQVVQSTIMRLTPEGSYSFVQGSATDGTYGYYLLSDQRATPGTSVICKVDLDTMTIVKQSEPLASRYAGSMTYHPGKNELILASSNADGTTLARISPDTLAVVGTYTVEFKALNIAYDVGRDAFAVGTAGTYDFFLLDGDLQVTDYISAVQTTSAEQECECYADRIFFAMSGDNRIYVYHWDGSFAYAITPDLDVDLENLVFHGDLVYLGGANDGSCLMEAIFYQELT